MRSWFGAREPRRPAASSNAAAAAPRGAALLSPATEAPTTTRAAAPALLPAPAIAAPPAMFSRLATPPSAPWKLTRASAGGRAAPTEKPWPVTCAIFTCLHSGRCHVYSGQPVNICAISLSSPPISPNAAPPGPFAPAEESRPATTAAAISGARLLAPRPPTTPRRGP